MTLSVLTALPTGADPRRGAPGRRAPKEPYAGDAQLVVACLLGILAVVLLITVVKLHPFLVAHARLRGARRGRDDAARPTSWPASSPASGRRPAPSACSSRSAR